MTLDEDDVDAIARRVLTLIRDELSAAPVRKVSAKVLAQVLDVKPSWVYAHAVELQRRLGGSLSVPNGRRPVGRRQAVMAVEGELLPLDPSDE